MEEDMKLLICRICFNIIPDKNFFLIKGSLKDMLLVVTTEVVIKQNLEKTCNPVMCGKCYKSLQETFTFKTNFFETEEMIEMKLPAKSNVKLDLTDVMSSSGKRTVRKSSIRTIQFCRTCLKVISNGKFVYLNDSNANSKLTSLLSSCVPEMDLRLTENPVICRLCYNALQKMQSFKALCSTSESKIDNFVNTTGADTLYKVNLHEVLHFSKSCSLSSDYLQKDCSNSVAVKMEYNEEGAEKGLRILDCLECVLVKMEPPEENEINFNHSSQSTASKPPKQLKDIGKNNGKGMTYCSDCDFKTKYKCNLRRHLIVAHKRKDIGVSKKYRCVHCTFSTKRNIDLTRHLLSHVKPEALKCTRCAYSTDQNSQLIKHILSHVNPQNMDKYKFLQLFKKTN